jgi:hypothetical protein
MHLVDTPHGTFTDPELARLAIYKAAVEAGFYTDWDGSTARTNRGLLVHLLRPHASAPVEYPFTPDEQRRLERYRAAVQAGVYADDLPPA